MVGVKPVTVVIPVHNAGRFLRLAVDSVLSQTYTDFELDLTDDGSSDGCLDSLSDIVDERLRIFRQPQKGAPATMNAAVAGARGEILAFLDHDDLWLPEKLACHMQWLSAHEESDLTFDWSRMIDSNGADLGLPSQTWEGVISFERLVEDFVIANTSAMVVRKSALHRAGPFNEAFPRAYDADMCWRVAALRPDNCCSVGRQLTLYRRHTGQMSRDWRQLQREWEELLRAVPGYAPRPLADTLRVADSNMRRYFAALACEQGERRSAVKLALSAFAQAPRQALGDTRNWMVLAGTAANAVLPRQLFESFKAWGIPRFRRRRVSSQL